MRSVGIAASPVAGLAILKARISGQPGQAGDDRLVLDLLNSEANVPGCPQHVRKPIHLLDRNGRLKHMPRPCGEPFERFIGCIAYPAGVQALFAEYVRYRVADAVGAFVAGVLPCGENVAGPRAASGTPSRSSRSGATRVVLSSRPRRCSRPNSQSTNRNNSIKFCVTNPVYHFAPRRAVECARRLA